MNKNTPPLVSGGLPVLGHALEMMRNREDSSCVGCRTRRYFCHQAGAAVRGGGQWR